MSARPRKHFEIRIEALSEAYVEQAARIHAVCFPQRIETLLGHDCICDVYRTRFLGPQRDTFCLIAIHTPDGRLAAYLCGSEPMQDPELPHGFINPRVFRRHLLRKVWRRPDLWGPLFSLLRQRLLHKGCIEGADKPVPEWASVAKLLGIDPEFRGGNIGVDLMLAIEGEARKRGARRLMGLVEQTNIKAEKLYKSIGWVRTSPDADKYTVFAMHKDIDDERQPKPMAHP
jgi:ribosomal protein S18 acetylase RimI-like enzyme